MRLSHERSQHSINFNRFRLPSLSFHALLSAGFRKLFPCLLTLVPASQECFNILYENFYQFAFRSCDRMWNKLYCEFIMINLYFISFFFLTYFFSVAILLFLCWNISRIFRSLHWPGCCLGGFDGWKILWDSLKVFMVFSAFSTDLSTWSWKLLRLF